MTPPASTARPAQASATPVPSERSRGDDTAEPPTFAPAHLRGLLFDLDETLIDTRTAQAGRVASFLHAHLPIREVTAAPAHEDGDARVAQGASGPRPVEGDGLRGLLRRAAERVATLCYRRVCRAVTLSAEAERLLAAVQEAGLSFGIVSNGAAQKRHTLHLLGLDQKTSCLFVSGACGQRKPGKAIFLAAAECLGLPPEEILFVGDKATDDVAGARRVGMRTAWLRSKGARGKSLLPPGADVTLDALDALRTVLQRGTV